MNEDHPDRFRLANELHARPFPAMHAPGQVSFMALQPVGSAAGRDRSLERDHLIALLDRFGVAHPEPEATHFFGKVGDYDLKWESHTEFFSYTIFHSGLSDRPFDGADFDLLPADWLADAPGVKVTSLTIRVEEETDPEEIAGKLSSWMVSESTAVSYVVERAAVIAGDFRIDSNGQMRFAAFFAPGTDKRRVGRIVQRMTEIETYKAMAMQGFRRSQMISPRLSNIADRLAGVVSALGRGGSEAEAVLRDLLSVSAELEKVETDSAFRFAAARAYESIVHDRIAVLGEERFMGRQTFSEFMLRRFDPAMRTVKSTEDRKIALSRRATRAGELLRTQVEVDRSAQNQALLESMDRRADLQLRLQETVEGLSVVAISYYGVNLAGYLVMPFVEEWGFSKGQIMAALTVPVVALVWVTAQRIRKKIGH